jgi:uncharacterized protein
MKKLISILMLLWTVPSFADYNEGISAFERGDYEKAVKEFRALAENDDPEGQYGMAIMYDMGEGVNKNSVEAVKWYQLSARQGHPDAQNNLGVMYENGEGVAKDYNEALKWYRKAAERGNKDAPNNVGVLYMTGVGVRRNYVKAYMWFSVAGNDVPAKKNKKFIARRLTEVEIAQAIKMAKEWLQIRNKKNSSKE